MHVRGLGCGQTSGGFKCIRAMMVLKVMRNEFKRILHPTAVLPIKVNGQHVPQDKILSLMSFLAIYVLM